MTAREVMGLMLTASGGMRAVGAPMREALWVRDVSGVQRCLPYA